MEPSSNEHHLSSSPSSSSICYGLGTSSHAWSATSYSVLGTNGFHCYPIEQPSMAHDLSFHWADSDAFLTTHSNTLRTKDEFPEHPMNKIQFSPANQILVPDFNNGIVSETPISYDNMNLEALDLLACSKFSRIFDLDSSQFQVGISGDGFNYIPASLSTSYKVSASTNGAAEATKKSNTFKKPRLENCTYCPPLKVRKEKLGDRIAALQQLVAPFGKTDTASVLKEVIGYIKFLQNQVETLSVPYMKASRSKPIRATKHDTENEQMKHDLKSRGLCLVPLSCLSYVDDGAGAAVWPPVYYGGT